MAIVQFSLDEARQLRLTPEQEAALDCLSPEQIEANALADPDNPPMTDEELAIAAAARMVRQTRHASGLTREAFASRYRLEPEKLSDWEQGRAMPDPLALSYLRVIAREPEAVNRALQAAE